MGNGLAERRIVFRQVMIASDNDTGRKIVLARKAIHIRLRTKRNDLVIT